MPRATRRILVAALLGPAMRPPSMMLRFLALAWLMFPFAAPAQHDKAIADYTDAIRRNPSDATAYFNRGLAWQSKQEYDKAIADYNKAIRLNPKTV
jgi:tetratricopeptide (TPR) repeat protein